MYDIITVGSNTLDAFVKTGSEVRRVYHKREENGEVVETYDESLIYPVGDKIPITHLEFKIGGGGTNTAVSFSRLGLKTGYVGKIGEDYNGLRVFNYLKKENIDFLGTTGDQTGFSVILDSVAEDRTILNYRGCSNDLKYSELNKKSIQTKWFYFSSMLGESFKTLKKLSEYKGVKIAFNPSSYQAKEGIDVLKPILKNTDLLIFNKEESQLLTGEEDMKKVLTVLKKVVKGSIIITDGANGILAFDKGSYYRAHPKKDLNIVETTGAGDAFASAVTAGFIIGHSFKKCLKLGLIQSEAVIQAYGAKENLLKLDKLKELERKDDRKIKKISFEEVGL